MHEKPIHVVASRVRAIVAAGALAATAIAVLPRSAAGEAFIPPPGGGGNAPHGAMPMEPQLSALTQLLGEPSKVERPTWIGPLFWASLIPAGSPGDEPHVALGRRLYFEPRLSRDGTVACATCHDVSRGFTDRRATSEGIGGQISRRNSPTTMNAFLFSTQFWDGRSPTLEEQAKLPILNPIEMGMPDGQTAVSAIAKDPSYQQAFRNAYGRDVNFDDTARAIAAFERTLVFLQAPFDRFARGQTNAISDDARAGFALFQGKGRCISCHQMNAQNPLGTDNRFHNVGVSARHQDFEKLAAQALVALEKDSSKESIDQLALQTDLSELGRFVVTRNTADIGGFKTPAVRNVGVTAPYMHDGSLTTLWDVMDHYNKGGEPNLYLDGGMEPLALTEREIDQLVAFMFTLTDDRLASQNRAEMERQRAIARQRRPFRDDALASRKVLLFERRVTGAK